MKLTYLSFILILFFGNIVAQKSTKTNEELQKEVNKWLVDANVPGIAIAKIEKGNVTQTILAGKDTKGEKITSLTLFDVASLTKTITTLTALKLVEQKDLDLIFSFLGNSNDRQTMLYSATVPDTVKLLSQKLLRKNHEFVNTVSDEDQQTNAQVVQQFFICELDQQVKMLKFIFSATRCIKRQVFEFLNKRTNCCVL